MSEDNYYLAYLHSEEEAEKLGIEVVEKLENGLYSIRATEEAAKALIPDNTPYCYGANRKMCPFWDSFETLPKQSNGFCHFLGEGDFTKDGTFLLWDACKECGIKEENESDIK